MNGKPASALLARDGDLRCSDGAGAGRPSSALLARDDDLRCSDDASTGFFETAFSAYTGIDIHSVPKDFCHTDHDDDRSEPLDAHLAFPDTNEEAHFGAYHRVLGTPLPLPGATAPGRASQE